MPKKDELKEELDRAQMMALRTPAESNVIRSQHVNG